MLSEGKEDRRNFWREETPANLSGRSGNFHRTIRKENLIVMPQRGKSQTTAERAKRRMAGFAQKKFHLRKKERVGTRQRCEPCRTARTGKRKGKKGKQRQKKRKRDSLR